MGKERYVERRAGGIFTSFVDNATKTKTYEVKDTKTGNSGYGTDTSKSKAIEKAYGNLRRKQGP